MESVVNLVNMMSFWQKKRVLITGHTGFKGSWLSLWLQLLKAEVIGFALPPPTNPNLFTLAQIANGMTNLIGDIRDYSSINNVINQYKPEIIIHMAAQPLVRYSYNNPVETYTTNVMGTVHLLEAARLTNTIKAIVNVTTDKCYQNNECQIGYREDDSLGGFDPYSNSKACSEFVTSAYRHSYFNQNNVGLASARAGNVIGGGDFAADRLIPDIIRSYINRTPILIRYPNAVRPWQHVLEPLKGYLLLAQRLYESPMQYSESFNFGPSDSEIKPVRWIIDYINRYVGDEIQWMQDENFIFYETSYLKLNCSKARERLGWQSHWNLEKGLHATIDWYQAYQKHENVKNVMIEQIENFMNEKF